MTPGRLPAGASRPDTARYAGQRGPGTPLASGIIWNAAALVFMALAGIVLNLAIGRAYGASALGTFNIAFALYIAFSQVAAFGLHLSALHHVAAHAGDSPQPLATLVRSGLVPCLATAVVVTAVALASVDVVAAVFDSIPDLAAAWMVAAPGLVAFALNKYLLGVLNALQHMRTFAALQALRYLLIMLVLGALYAADSPAKWLASALSIAEWGLLAIALPCVGTAVPGLHTAPLSRDDMRHHVRFGARVLPAGVVSELNSRIDVLMVGALLGDRMAGIYSVAGLVFEAALQAVMVIRNNLNPRIARAIAAAQTSRMLRDSRVLAAVLTPLLAVGAALTWWLLPHTLPLVFPTAEFAGVAEPLAWLLLALPLAGAPLCFGMVLSLAGLPFWQSVQMSAATGICVGLSWVLIPALGLAGAAIAMGTATIATGLIGVVLIRRLRGIRLFL